MAKTQYSRSISGCEAEAAAASLEKSNRTFFATITPHADLDEPSQHYPLIHQNKEPNSIYIKTQLIYLLGSSFVRAFRAW